MTIVEVYDRLLLEFFTVVVELSGECTIGSESADEKRWTAAAGGRGGLSGEHIQLLGIQC